MDSIFHKLKVIELASVLAGPSAGQFFAELGATVVKIENPFTDGDVTRSWKLPGEDKASDKSAYFLSVNWGKRHLYLDIRKEKDYAQLMEQLKQADVLITSYKPGDAEKLRVDYPRLSAINPRLIYGSISGYGKDNARPGYDAIIQAESGFMYMNGEPQSLPTKMPVALIDVLTAHQLKEGLLLALMRREQTGKGSLVEVSLFEAAVASLANQALNWLHAGHIPERLGSEHPNISPYGTVFFSQDEKPLVLAVGNDRQFASLCDVLGIGELVQNEKFRRNPQRVVNNQELTSILRSKIRTWKRDEFMARLHECHVPAGAVNDMKDVFESSLAQGMILESDGLPGLKQIAFSIDERAKQAPEDSQ